MIAKISAIISMGRTKPVDSFAGMIDAASKGTRTPLPGIPVLEKPIINAHIIEIAHWRDVKSNILLKSLNQMKMSIKDMTESGLFIFAILLLSPAPGSQEYKVF